MMKKTYMKGSYTVEAAAVVTITLFVLASLILCTFYIHDRAVMQGLVCEAAAVGSSFATEEEREAALQEAVKGLTGERFLGSRELNGNATSSGKRVIVSWKAKYPLPGFAAKYLSQGELGIERSWTCRITDPAESIRIIKGAGELLTGGDN